MRLIVTALLYAVALSIGALVVSGRLSPAPRSQNQHEVRTLDSGAPLLLCHGLYHICGGTIYSPAPFGFGGCLRQGFVFSGPGPGAYYAEGCGPTPTAVTYPLSTYPIYQQPFYTGGYPLLTQYGTVYGPSYFPGYYPYYGVYNPNIVRYPVDLCSYGLC